MVTLLMTGIAGPSHSYFAYKATIVVPTVFTRFKNRRHRPPYVVRGPKVALSTHHPLHVTIAMEHVQVKPGIDTQQIKNATLSHPPIQCYSPATGIPFDP